MLWQMIVELLPHAVVLGSYFCLDASDILNYLLENPRTTQTYQAENGCYRTYLGTPIYLNVTVNQSREGTEEITLVAVFIRSNLATAAAVHMAVQQRLQVQY